MTRFKKTVLFIHRWLGFTSGLVVFIVSITGCLFVFQDDIQDAFYDYRKVEVQQKPYLQPTQLRQLALNRYKDSKPGFIGLYGPDRPALVMVTNLKQETRYIYLNPYTGQFLYDENVARSFFIVVEYIHLYLLLPPAVGQQIVGISVIVFVVLMITGIIMWWPKRKSDRKRSFTIKWGGRWRRVNYDLHNVLGFYACSIAIILAITGLAIAYEWMSKGIYKAANLGAGYAYEENEPVSDSLKKGIKFGQPMIDYGFSYARKQSPGARMFFISDAEKATDPVYVTAYYKSMHYYRSDGYVFDQYTGKVLRNLPHAKKSAGLKLNNMNYDIHVGQILGFPGKVIAFFISLICASLPVTGFMVWLGKRNKKPKIKRPAKLALV